MQGTFWPSILVAVERGPALHIKGRMSVAHRVRRKGEGQSVLYPGNISCSKQHDLTPTKRLTVAVRATNSKRRVYLIAERITTVAAPPGQGLYRRAHYSITPRCGESDVQQQPSSWLRLDRIDQHGEMHECRASFVNSIGRLFPSDDRNMQVAVRMGRRGGRYRCPCRSGTEVVDAACHTFRW